MDGPITDVTVESPVKLVLQRRARPGAQAAFEAWIRELLDSAGRTAALQGSSVLTAGNGDYFILLRFATHAERERWEGAPAVRELFRRGDALATSSDGPVAKSGLETWFTLPGLPAPRSAPPAWKMALVTWCALLPQVLLLGVILPPGLPYLAGVAVSTAIPVAMLTWVIMPRLTKLLYGWLYATAGDGGRA